MERQYAEEQSKFDKECKEIRLETQKQIDELQHHQRRKQEEERRLELILQLEAEEKQKQIEEHRMQEEMMRQQRQAELTRIKRKRPQPGNPCSIT